MSSDDFGNKIWIDGVRIPVMSGDVSALEQTLTDTLEEGGGWIRFEQPDHALHLHVTPSTSVVIDYIEY